MATMPAQRVTTAADLLAPEFPHKHCELWDGVLLVRDPSGVWSDGVGEQIARLLGNHVASKRLGLVMGSSGGFVLARDPDRVLSPDVAFVRRERLKGIDLAHFFEGAPDLAVEVRSHTDRWPDVLEKCGIWIAHGARLVWAVEPWERTVEVFEPGKPSRGLTVADTLSGDPVLPDFRVPVAGLFPEVP